MNNKLISNNIYFLRSEKDIGLIYSNLSELDVSLEIVDPESSNDRITVYCYSSDDGKTIGLDIDKETGNICLINSVDKTAEIRSEDFIFPEGSIRGVPRFSINDFKVDDRFQDIGIYDLCGVANLVIYNNAVSFVFGDLDEGSINLMPCNDLLYSLSTSGSLLCITSRCINRSSIQHLL